MDGSLLVGYALLVLVLVLTFGTIPALIIWNRRKVKRTASKLSTDIRPCSICAASQIKRGGLLLCQQKLTGLALATNYETFKDYVCPTHARNIHDDYQHHTQLYGWWTPSGFLKVPQVLSENRMHYEEYTRAFSTVPTNTHIPTNHLAFTYANQVSQNILIDRTPPCNHFALWRIVRTALTHLTQ